MPGGISSTRERSEILGKFVERYHRQMLLKEWRQEKLLNARVLIAGVGALGTVAAANLAMMGVGTLVLVDFDTVELSNLNRQILFSEDDVGKPKVVAARDRLLEINSDIQIVPIHADLRSLRKEIFERCDVVIDCLDNFETRRWLNALCVKMRKPLVHGGIYGWYGNVQVVIPFETPCLECHPLVPQQRWEGSCTRPDAQQGTEVNEPVPSISPVAMTIGAIQAMETVKILMGLESVLRDFLFYDALSETFTRIKLERNPECAVCGEKFRVDSIELPMRSLEASLREILEDLRAKMNLEDPEVIVAGRIYKYSDAEISLRDLGLSEGSYIFVIDRRLERPLKLKLVRSS